MVLCARLTDYNDFDQERRGKPPVIHTPETLTEIAPVGCIDYARLAARARP